MAKIVELTIAAQQKRAMQEQADAVEGASEAYQALFQGETAAKVLKDLARVTGYFDTLPDNATEAQLRTHNARRAIFERIINMAELNATRVATLRHEMVAADTSQTVRNPQR